MSKKDFVISPNHDFLISKTFINGIMTDCAKRSETLAKLKIKDGEKPRVITSVKPDSKEVKKKPTQKGGKKGKKNLEQEVEELQA